MTHDIISEIRQHLEADRRATLSLLGRLNADEAQRRPRADAWSIKDHVAHLSAFEGAVIAFARRVLEEERPVAGSYDIDAWNARQQAVRADFTWEETLAELSAVREQLLALLEEVPVEALSRLGSHPVWGEPITLASVLRVPYRHEPSHRYEIEALRAV
jgi:hypothetical protein